MLHVQRNLLIHERTEDGTPCPCCGSREAVLVETLPWRDFLVDRFNGKTVHRHKQTPELQALYDERVATSPAIRSIPANITVSRHQAEILTFTDDTGIRPSTWWLAFAHRWGKTSVAARWLDDQIWLYGGRNRECVWVSYELETCWMALATMFIGTEETPAIVPPELIIQCPTSQKDKDWSVRLLNGTRVVWKHTKRKGAPNMRGYRFFAAVWDEATATPSADAEEYHHQIEARLLSDKGSLFVPTTPKHGHYIYPLATGPGARTMDDARQALLEEQKPPRDIRAEFSIYTNPWIDPAETDAKIESKGGKREPLSGEWDMSTLTAKTKRDYFGLWTPEGELRFKSYRSDLHLTDSIVHFGRIDQAGYVDITPKIAAAIFRGHSSNPSIQLIGGCDFNVRPMSMAICKVLVRKGTVDTDPLNWILYVHDLVQQSYQPNTWDFAKYVKDEAHRWCQRGEDGKLYAQTHLVCDGTGFGDYRGVKKTQDVKYLRDAGFICRAPDYEADNRTPKNPLRGPRFQTVNWLLDNKQILLNRSRTMELQNSFMNEIEAEKRSGDAQDRLSSATDALGYLAWAIFDKKLPI